MGFDNGRLVRASISATLGGEEQVNTLHYDLDDVTSTPNDPQELADRLRDDWRPFFAARYFPSWSIGPVIVVEEVDPLHPTDPRAEWVSGTAIAGTKLDTGNRLPHGLTALASLRTAHIGRRYTGRMFMGGSWQEDNQDDGGISSTWLGYLANELAAIPRQPDLATGISLAHANWVVYSRTARATPGGPEYAAPITATIVRPKLHYLKRRAVY